MPKYLLPFLDLFHILDHQVAKEALNRRTSTSPEKNLQEEHLTRNTSQETPHKKHLTRNTSQETPHKKHLTRNISQETPHKTPHKTPHPIIDTSNSDSTLHSIFFSAKSSKNDGAISIGVLPCRHTLTISTEGGR
jgi:hypothetical protein